MRDKFKKRAADIIYTIQEFLPTPRDLIDEDLKNINKEKENIALKIAQLEFALFIMMKTSSVEKDPLSLQYLLYNHTLFLHEQTEQKYKYAVQKLCYWFPQWRIETVLEETIVEYKAICQEYNRTQISFYTEQGELGGEKHKELFKWNSLPIHDMTMAYEKLCERHLLSETQSLHVIKSSVGLIEDYYHQVHAIEIPHYLQKKENIQQHVWSPIKNTGIKFEYKKLLETAKEMDNQLPGNQFEKRLNDIAIYDINNSNQLIQTQQFTIVGTEHWVGPLGVGKSTFTKVIAYYLSKKITEKKRLTIFVKDIAEVISLTEELTALGIKTEALISHNEREKHVDKYLRYMSTYYGDENLEKFQSSLAKRFLSICPLLSNNSIQEEVRPPCFKIVEKSMDRSKDDFTVFSTGTKCVCPYFANCDYTLMYRNLAAAEVIVTTIPSTINTKVPAVLSDKKMTFFEFLNVNSHLVLMDESDKHQLMLDEVFMSTEKLFNEHSIYLSVLQAKILQNSRLNRLRRSNKHFQSWLSLFDKTAASVRDVADIMDDAAIGFKIRSFIGKSRFTSVNLLRKVMFYCYKKEQSADEKEALQSGFEKYAKSIKEFNSMYKSDDYLKFISNDSDAKKLVEIANVENLEIQLKEAKKFLVNTFTLDVQDEELIVLANNLVLAIYFMKLEKNLALLSTNFKVIMNHLDEEAKSYFYFFNKKRNNYEGVCPIPLLGVQYGFTLQKNDVQISFSEVEVYDYEAVGRYLLVKYSDLYEGFTHQKGANAILLSATSFSPNSHKYHIQLPPKRAILSTRTKKPKLHYTFAPQFENKGYVQISGLYDQRQGQIRRLATSLVQSSFLTTVLQKLPINRKRALIVMTSYDAAKMMAEALVDASPIIAKEMALLVQDKKKHDLRYPTVTRDEVPDIVKNYKDIKYLIIPLESIDRGMNILLDDASGLSAFSSILYCMRPYPVPSDQLNKMRKSNVFTLNQSTDAYQNQMSISQYFIDRRNQNFAFMSASYEKYGYRALNEEERNTLLMDYQVSMYQLEGRLIRGGSDGFVYFLDSAFMPETVNGKIDTYKTSMLEGWRHLNAQLLQTSQKEIVKELYQTRIDGLNQLEIIMPYLNEEIVDDY